MPTPATTVRSSLYLVAKAMVYDLRTVRDRVPYQGIPSFWRAPVTQDIDDADVVVYGMPFDLGTTYRPGARLGPRAIREASCYVGAFECLWPHSYSFNQRYKLIDYGDFSFLPGNVRDAIQEISDGVDRILQLGLPALGLGGDHFVAYPELKAYAKRFGSLSLIHFDAHTDSYEATLETLPTHGSPFWFAVEEGLVDPETSIQMGIRTQIPDKPSFKVVTANECFSLGTQGIITQIQERVGDRPCFLSLDVDGLDPAYTPGTGTPVIGGLTSAMQRELLWALKQTKLNIVGADVVEVAPQYDPTDRTAITAATLAMDILHILAENHRPLNDS